MRIWWGAQRTRANYGEFVQAINRVVIGLSLSLFFFLWVDWDEYGWVAYFIAGFLTVAAVLFAWIYRMQETSDTVRFVTLAIDLGSATVLLSFGGEWGAIALFLYTWVAVGHGFRYGLQYLYIAWIVSLVAFSMVYAISTAVEGFWFEHPLLWLGAFLWVGAPTFYVAQLLKQKLAAVRAAEEARAQVERAQAEAARERAERARAEAERAAAEAEAASEAKSEFLATMSHEMRTPLNGVVGAAELLAGTDLPQRERQLVDWLLTSSRQLRSLIDNLLDLRKIEAGKMTIESAPLDLHALMNRLAALFEPEAKRAHLRFTKGISPEAPYLLNGDNARIQQVLINLVANALKFTRQGFIRVSVSAQAQTEQEVTLRFEVRDTGIGIPPEKAGRIFDRFTQADDSIHRQYGGSGLGTTICKHLVELMGGTIGFDSEPGIGTTFWFTVPVSRPPAEAYEDGFAVSVRGAQVHLVSGRAAETAWLARTARQKQLQLSSVRSVQEAIGSARQSATGSCLLLVDGEDDRVAWRDAPSALRREGVQWPCVLLHQGASETEAFDAGYACLLKSQEPALLVRAVRSVVAGYSSVEPAADFPGQEPSARGALRVLVAEDNQISQQIIAMMLQAGGHAVTIVGDGDSVLERYRDGPFDVVVLDMHMPGRTGLEVARAIRTLEAASRSRRMPIIMLTAAASTDLREDSLDAGVDLFLSKPVDPRALLRGVNQVFSGPDRAGDDAPADLRAPEDGCIDRVLLKDMADLARDPAFLQTLTRKFSAEARQLLDLIEAAVIGRDRPRFRELTHALKGTAMMAGAIRLRDSVARAETVADTDFDGVGAEMIREMRAALEATNHELSRVGTASRGLS
jgi:two-component system, sensor histidine kinase RpfC